MSEIQQPIDKDSMPDISIKECLLEGWEMFKKHWIILIIVLILKDLLVSILFEVPVVGFYLFYFIDAPILAGTILILLNSGRDTNPSYKNFQVGYNRFFQSHGLLIIISYCFVIFSMPIIQLLNVNTLMNTTSSRLDLISIIGNLAKKEFIFAIVPLFIFILIFIRYSFCFFILVDDPKPKFTSIFRKSVFLTQGYSFNILIMFFLYMILEVFLEFLLNNLFGIIDSTYLGILEMFSSISTFIFSTIYLLIFKVLESIAILVFVRYYEKLKAIKYPVIEIQED